MGLSFRGVCLILVYVRFIGGELWFGLYVIKMLREERGGEMRGVVDEMGGEGDL